MGIRMGFGWMLDMEDERNQIDVLWGEWSRGGGVLSGKKAGSSSPKQLQVESQTRI